jgi:hypothetical protein
MLEKSLDEWTPRLDIASRFSLLVRQLVDSVGRKYVLANLPSYIDSTCSAIVVSRRRICTFNGNYGYCFARPPSADEG